MELNSKLHHDMFSVLKKSDLDSLSINELRALYTYGKMKINHIEGESFNFKQSNEIKKGTLIHLVILDKGNKISHPKKILLNCISKDDITLPNFNELLDPDDKAPANWFIKMGFTVNSKSIENYWLQIVHAPGFSKLESYIDYKENILDRKTKNQIEIGKHFDNVKQYHKDKVDVEVLNNKEGFII